MGIRRVSFFLLGLRQVLFRNREPFAVRRGQSALRVELFKNIDHLLPMASRLVRVLGKPPVQPSEITLPPGISRVGRGEAFEDCEGCAVGSLRPGEIALVYQKVAYSFVRDCEIALPPGIGRVGCNEEFADREGGAVGGLGPGEITLGN